MPNYPLIAEIAYIDPVNFFAALPRQGALFLDSASNTSQGRYSFIAWDPFAMLNPTSTDPFTVMQALLDQYHLPLHPDLPPFQGGIAGMLSYELSQYLEKLPLAAKDDLHFPETLLGLYDIVMAWDHWQQKTWIFSSGFPETEPQKRLRRAKQRLHWAQALSMLSNHEMGSYQPECEFTSTFTPDEYQRAVHQVIEYIRAGDIFEANISQRFKVRMTENFSPFHLYRVLRKQNPAPFSAYLQYGQYVIASASPERFLQLSQNKVQARPIKGTAARYADTVQDQKSALELTQSEKDRAENMMIVDLMRNDLSRVCLPHSVSVPQLCGLESFASVHHLVSVVEGILRPEKGMGDLLRATFPAGSITGAPKIRAMEIIAELEPVIRGPYCGSIGYLGFNGEMDLSVTIRTLVIVQNVVTYHVGGAVTVDSSPCREYHETLLKAEKLRMSIVGLV